MRHVTLVALLVLAAACATSRKPAADAGPVAAAPAPEALTVEFASVEATRSGGKVVDTVYSEKPGDVQVARQTFKDGIITYAGQVGMGKGSAWAGLGLNWTINAESKPVDGSRFKSVTFRLAATSGALRLRITGANDETRANGCYPVYTQAVTEELKEYTIPVEKFQPEGWCGKKGVSIKETLPAVIGNEVASVTVSGKPITISVGKVTYNP